VLFDLQSPGRRRFIKVIYAGLAILMGGGLILFGIGSDASGGLSEIFNGGSSGDTGFEDQIEDAEKKLETNPQDSAALAELVQLHFQAGNTSLGLDEASQQPIFTTEAAEEYRKAADSWDRYVKLSKGEVNSSTALYAVQAFSALANGELQAAAGGSGQEALDNADGALAAYKGAAEAQQVIADQKGDANSYGTLAYNLYFAGEFEAGDAATQQALAAAKGDEAKELEKELEQVEQQGRQLNSEIEAFRKQLAKAGAGAPGGDTGGENPLSGLGGAGGLGGGSAGGGLATP